MPGASPGPEKENETRVRAPRSQVRKMQELGKPRGFSHNAVMDICHVPASAIQRRRVGTQISHENRKIANRLERVGLTGGIKSSGYAQARPEIKGPLAKRNMEITRRGRPARIEQPEMSF